MSSYWDVYGRLHHKPCVDGVPSSNNGWIYTAYADKLMTIDLNKNSLTECFSECIVKDDRDNRSFLIRSPGKDLPPMSRDEILGMASLGFLRPMHLNGWNFSPFPLPCFSFIKLVKQLWQLCPSFSEPYYNEMAHLNIGYKLEYKHRNYFWQNNLDQIYRFAFSVPLQDRAFLLECFGETRRLSYFFYKAIAMLDARFAKPKNGIPWLKYNKSIEAMQTEFPTDHPLRGQ